jgi:hypothetical protein
MQFALREYGSGSESGGKVLVSRAHGAAARGDLERRLADPAIGRTDPVALDFDWVIAVDVPFADAFLGPLLSGRLAGYHGEHPLVAINVSEGVRETVDATLRQRRLHLLGITSGRPAELLGGDDILELTLRAAMAKGRFSASDLARQLNITPQAMNNRLKILLESGALSRMRTVRPRGGKEFEYQVPVLPADEDEADTGAAERARHRAGPRSPA